MKVKQPLLLLGGALIGVLLTFAMPPVSGQGRPPMLGYGRTSGGVNVPIQVDATGAVKTTGGSSGSVTSVATTSPLTGGPITTTGTIACATCGVTGSPLSQFAATTSAQLAGVISDETGTGVLVFGTSPNFTTGATIGTVAIPTISSTNTFTNKRVTRRVVTAADATSITPNTDSADITYQLNAQSAGTLTINPDGGTPTNGQPWLLKIKSTNVQTFSWDTTYVGGTTALPTASTGSNKIDYFAFVYDTVASKWDYVGTAAGF